MHRACGICQVGRTNARLNGVAAQITFTRGYVGKEGDEVDGERVLSTAKLLGGRKETSVDVLHMDVQGAEASVLEDMSEWLRDGKARYAESRETLKTPCIEESARLPP